MSVELEPSELGFKRPFTTEVSQTLRLVNPHGQQVAFKVKTTAPKQYCVRPNSGRIEPNGSVEVQVLLQAMKEDPPLDTRCRDKFLVQSVAIPSSSDSSSNITQIWQSIEATAKSSIQEKKIRVTFLPADGQANGVQHASSESPPPAYSNASTAAVTPQARRSEAPASAVGAVSMPDQKPEGSKSLGDARESAHNPATDNSTYTSTIGGAAAAVASAIPTSQDDLKRQLEEAKATISRLQEQASEGLRQRKTPQTADGDEKSSSSSGLAMRNAPPGGVPVQVAAGLCLFCFLVAYLFF